MWDLLASPGVHACCRRRQLCVFALSLPRALGCLVLPRPYRGTLCLRMGSSTMPQRDKT